MASTTEYKLPGWLPGGFKVAAHRWYVDDERPCWLAQFDQADRPCEPNYRGEPVEAFHFFSRGEIRNYLKPQLLGLVSICELTRYEVEEIVAQAEWDPRNGGPGCVVHHQAFDGKRATGLRIPVQALPTHVLQFALHRDLQHIGERKFEGTFPLSLAARFPGIVDLAREQSPRILGGQPSA